MTNATGPISAVHVPDMDDASTSLNPLPPQAEAIKSGVIEPVKLRLSAEQIYAGEISALRRDPGHRPIGWKMTPKAVMTYIMGGKAHDGTVISPKYVGDRRLIETAVSTLATDRGLLIVGVPGTAKSWISEHLAAAISGDSTMVIQGTAGTDENQIRYGWNYARLIADGPSRDALVPTPLMRAMEEGTICRIEELTRIGSDVQDSLITVMSEKMMPIPEINASAYAVRGFNIIATANNNDKGVNKLSSALERRFNVVVLPLPSSIEEEVGIVSKRVAEMANGLDLPAPRNVVAEITRVVTIFRELRSGMTSDNRSPIKSPSGGLSPAEAISVVVGGIGQCSFFNDGNLDAASLAGGMIGAIVKDPVQDRAVLDEYLHAVLRRRGEYRDFYAALSGRA